ncbi:MAG: nucleotidyltransferase family protein [Prevotella sp.]|nr:nucleotidyltransferase family protein [Prevotella sp.]
MTSIDDILLSLTRAALWDTEPHLDAPLSPAAWEQLYHQARKQTVQGIVYDAVCRLPEAQLPPDDLLGMWMEEVLYIEATHHRHLKALTWVTSRMEAESTLRPIVLKGLPIANLYPAPHHRVSGDIDLFYGSLAAVNEADRQVESWGIPITRGLYGESSYLVNDVPIEHHGLLVHSHVPWRKRRLRAWIEQRLSDADATTECSIGNNTVKVLSPELDLLQLSSHALKHALNEGIGLRQLCDIALFVTHHREKLPPETVRPILKRFGLLRWTDLCLSYGVEHLGIRQEQLPFPVHASKGLVASMHDEVMQSGNFGFLDERYHTQGIAPRQKATARRITRNVWRYMRLSPQEALCWSLGLAAVRAGEKAGMSFGEESEESE